MKSPVLCVFISIINDAQNMDALHFRQKGIIL